MPTSSSRSGIRGRPSMDLSTPFAATRPTRLLIDGTWVVSEGSGIDELMN